MPLAQRRYGTRDLISYALRYRPYVKSRSMPKPGPAYALRILKKVHIYLGLLNLTIILVFGIAGLTASVNASFPGEPAPVVTERVFHVPAGLRDIQIGDLVYQTVRPPFVSPRLYPVFRNANHELIVDFYSVSGMQHITVLPAGNKLRIESHRKNIWEYMNRLHATTGRPADLKLRLWAYYVEFSIWSLLAMVLTGLYMWLASRRQFRWAGYAFVAGAALVVVLWRALR